MCGAHAAAARAAILGEELEPERLGTHRRCSEYFHFSTARGAPPPRALARRSRYARLRSAASLGPQALPIRRDESITGSPGSTIVSYLLPPTSYLLPPVILLSVKRLRIGVLYGGRSGEHEVSLASAAAVFANLDRSKYEPVAIRIEKDGRWALADKPPIATSAAEVIEQSRVEAARQIRAGREVHLVSRPSEETILSIKRAPASSPEPSEASVTGLHLDVIFPVLHGPYGEDGTIQGLLELANVPYVGAGVAASAIGMDKALMKVLFSARGLPVCDYRVVLRRTWERRPDEIVAALEQGLGFPMFVKPANLGSSVGISKAKDPASLREGMDLAASFDRKIVIEAAVPNAREIECAVLGNDEPETSLPGEVIPSREFYDYEAKYLDEGSRTIIPAELSPATTEEIRRLSIAAFQAIDCAGMARVDFLLSRDTGAIVLNEVNTIPGFTTISMYSKMWEASGLTYRALIDRLVELAMERHAAKQQLRTSLP
jgi:D-alanine-D-alanine ligase